MDSTNCTPSELNDIHASTLPRSWLFALRCLPSSDRQVGRREPPDCVRNIPETPCTQDIIRVEPGGYFGELGPMLNPAAQRFGPRDRGVGPDRLRHRPVPRHPRHTSLIAAKIKNPSASATGTTLCFPSDSG